MTRNEYDELKKGDEIVFVHTNGWFKGFTFLKIYKVLCFYDYVYGIEVEDDVGCIHQICRDHVLDAFCTTKNITLNIPDNLEITSTEDNTIILSKKITLEEIGDTFVHSSNKSKAEAIAKLLKVMDFLNLESENDEEKKEKWYLIWDKDKDKLFINTGLTGPFYFYSPDDVNRAVTILGKKTLKEALT